MSSVQLQRLLSEIERIESRDERAADSVVFTKWRNFKATAEASKILICKLIIVVNYQIRKQERL